MRLRVATRVHGAASVQLLESVDVLPPSPADGRAGFGARATVADRNDEHGTCEIVEPDEGDLAAERIRIDDRASWLMTASAPSASVRTTSLRPGEVDRDRHHAQPTNDDHWRNGLALKPIDSCLRQANLSPVQDRAF